MVNNLPNCWEGLKNGSTSRLEEEGLWALPLKSRSHLSPSASLCFLFCHMLLPYEALPRHSPDAVKSTDHNDNSLPAHMVVWKMGKVPFNPDTEWQPVSVSITTIPHTEDGFVCLFFLQRSAAAKEGSRKIQQQSCKAKAVGNRGFQAPTPYFSVFCNTWRYL